MKWLYPQPTLQTKIISFYLPSKLFRKNLVTKNEKFAKCLPLIMIQRFLHYLTELVADERWHSYNISSLLSHTSLINFIIKNHFIGTVNINLCTSFIANALHCTIKNKLYFWIQIKFLLLYKNWLCYDKIFRS